MVTHLQYVGVKIKVKPLHVKLGRHFGVACENESICVARHKQNKRIIIEIAVYSV